MIFSIEIIVKLRENFQFTLEQSAKKIARRAEKVNKKSSGIKLQ